MLMSFIIVSINWILRNIMITLIKSIGQDTYSQQLKSITNGVFIVQFFNTAILIILVQANFKEIGLPFPDSAMENINKIFNGPFYDFVPLWYVAVGYKLTQTLIIMAIFPFVEWGMAYYRQWLFRKLDNGWTNDTYKTKKTSMQVYIDIYSGPEYMIHFKYSGILNIAFVTMMYGVGMPILYLIAACAYFILYSLERLLVAYMY
jgi:hypothetical protein